MSVVVALFVVALLITVIGLFLSPKAQERKLSHTSTLPRQRVAKAAPATARAVAAPDRARRTAYPATSAMLDAPMKRRASAQISEAYTEVAYTQRARTTRETARTDATATQRTRAASNTARTGATTTPRTRVATNGLQPASTRSGQRVSRPTGKAASVAYPGPAKNLKDLLLSWQVGVPGLVMIFLLCFYLLNLTLPHSLLPTSAFFGSTNAPPTPASNSAPISTASQRLIRLGQLDPAQYQSMQQYNTWAYSACSAAAMTEVINAYGHTYHITDILTIEANIHEITPDLGLLEESGIQHTGKQFGFKTSWGHNLSLDQVIAVANSGTPVIVSFPPAKFPGGHILVVRGGNSSSVDLADSSRLNMTWISRDRFLQLWGGFSAIMTPA